MDSVTLDRFIRICGLLICNWEFLVVMLSDELCEEEETSVLLDGY